MPPHSSSQPRAAALAVTRLLRLADEVRRSLEQSFAPFGVTGQQYNVLRILAGASDPLPTMEVASRMMEKTPGLTGILDRLERKGLVRRERSRGDRRVWYCSITPDGRDLLHRMQGAVRRANVEALGGAKAKTLLALAAAIDAVREDGSRSFDADAPAPAGEH
jgi:DNA-binding MarR family transcriptional regulator